MKTTATNSNTPNNTYGWGVPQLCTANSSTIFTVGMNKADAQRNISVFPNPFNDELIINFETKIYTEVIVVLYDVLGKSLF